MKKFGIAMLVLLITPYCCADSTNDVKKSFLDFYGKFRTSIINNTPESTYPMMCYPFTAVNIDETLGNTPPKDKKISKEKTEKYKIATYLLSWHPIPDSKKLRETGELVDVYENVIEFIKDNKDPFKIATWNPAGLDISSKEIYLATMYFKKTSDNWCWYKSLYQTDGSKTPKPLR